MVCPLSVFVIWVFWVNYDTVASSVRLSPLLSVQLQTTLSPALPPLTLNARYGFLETEGPHSAVKTVLPASSTLTSVMYQAGMTAPAESLRWPVSISWFMRILISVTPSLFAARFFIGFAMCMCTTLVLLVSVVGYTPQ